MPNTVINLFLQHPDIKGNVATVYTHPLENSPGSSGDHYGGDTLTYMNTSEAMGKGMITQ